ncbi:MAG TPA: trypsin-like serine protease [Gemmatimonadaceae bacterium]|nr:trypsin-like serine protease [Gemmatimonadaceae bacterium]
MAVSLCAALVFTACAEPSGNGVSAPDGVRGIVNGEPTGSAYGNVGALLFDYWKNGVSGDDQWCTGSLITPTIFLTAAHCVVTPYTPAGSQFYVSFSSDLYAKSFKYIKATGYVYDPEYGRNTANLHDLALIFLPEGSTKGITPLQLPPLGYLDGLAAQGGLSKQLFVNVGYGSSSTRTGIPDFTYDGKRNTSKSEFMALQPTWLGLLMNSNATSEGGDCYGDSGGPKFLDGNPNMVLATVTTGDYPCRATTWDWRLDTPDARGFLGKYVKLP